MRNWTQNSPSILSSKLRAAAYAVVTCALLLLPMQPAQAQTLIPIHDFTGGADGATPATGLTMDRAGNFYGTTGGGGRGRVGVVFKLTKKNSNWILTPLYGFQGGSDGSNPQSRPIIGPDGRLYGTTEEGGGTCDASGCGIVYSLRPPATPCQAVSCPWQETVLHSFSGLDGANPESGSLAFDQAGNIYGTTQWGGAYYIDDTHRGYGAVYKLSSSNGGWTESLIYSFSGGADGSRPYGGVSFDNRGDLCGATTSGGGPAGAGTVYCLTPSGSGWSESTIYTFQNQQDGFGPSSDLILDQSGNFYGTTTFGGSGGFGTVYELTPSGGGWTFNLLYAFSGDPSGGPQTLLLANGNLYSNLSGYVDHDFGATVELVPTSGGWTQIVLHQFVLGDDGGVPVGSPVMDSAGNLYGMSNLGGTYGPGLVWEITP